MPITHRRTGEKGFALITALMLFLAGATAALATISGGVLREVKSVEDEGLSKQGYFASESGLEDAIYRIGLNKDMATSSVLSLSSSVASVLLSTLPDGSLDVLSSSVTGQVMRNTEANLLDVGSSTASSTIKSWRETQ
ncbi:MAG: hypothetical protein WC763_03675 [Candidatus Paceibacterota bacterium]|jgi:hypothetical protein